MNFIYANKFKTLSFLAFAASILLPHNASAVSTNNEIDLEFTLEPSINISITGDFLINNLIAGQSGSSSTPATVSITTNSTGGYVLGATVGNVNNASSSLISATLPSSYAFAMLGVSDAVALANFNNNIWGISYDSGATYTGLPLYTSDARTLKSSNAPANAETLSVQIGAKADDAKPAGVYENTINFIAVTQEPLHDLSTITTMQEMTAEVCAATTTPLATANATQYQLTDTRDNESYLVAKLADGKCWMLDNLRLDLTNSTVKSNLTSSTTNATDTILGYLKNGGGSSPYTAYAVAAATSTDYYDRPAIKTTYKDTTITSYGSGSGKIGVYYNYCAASAGSYCYSDSSSSGNASYDICPKGWRLPTGGSSGEFKALYTAYSSDASSFRSALSTPLSGSFGSGSAYLQGSYGYFWSSTRLSNTDMYLLSVRSSSVYPVNNLSRYYGNSIRCISQ